MDFGPTDAVEGGNANKEESLMEIFKRQIELLQRLHLDKESQAKIFEVQKEIQANKLEVEKELQRLQLEFETQRLEAEKELQGLQLELETLRLEAEKEIEAMKFEVEKEIQAMKLEVEKEIQTKKLEVEKELQRSLLEIETQRLEAAEKEIEAKKLEVDKEFQAKKLEVEKELQRSLLEIETQRLEEEKEIQSKNLLEVEKEMQAKKLELEKELQEFEAFTAMQLKNKEIQFQLDLKNLKFQFRNSEDLSSTASSIMSTSVSSSELEAAKAWTSFVVDKNVPRTFVSPDSLLWVEEPVVADLIWLKVRLSRMEDLRQWFEKFQAAEKKRGIKIKEEDKVMAETPLQESKSQNVAGEPQTQKAAENLLQDSNSPNLTGEQQKGLQGTAAGTKKVDGFETIYHPLLAILFEAASFGLNNVLRFVRREDFQTEGRREVILGYSIDSQREAPGACMEKVFTTSAFVDLDDLKSNGIDENASGLGKLYQVACGNESSHPTAHHYARICTFIEKADYIWFVKFNVEAKTLKSVEIAPSFQQPYKFEKHYLYPFDWLKKSCRIVCNPPAGFRLLVRYARAVYSMHSAHKCPPPVEFQCDDGNNLTISARATCLGTGGHAIVLRLSNSDDFVVKVSSQYLIEKEWYILQHVGMMEADSTTHIRKVDLRNGGKGQVIGLRGRNYYMDYEETEDEEEEEEEEHALGFLCLQGVGTLLPEYVARMKTTMAYTTDLWRAGGIMEHLFLEASEGLQSLHNHKILHRDIKPSNMIIVNGKLMLNDFDVSCVVKREMYPFNIEVGTHAFKSPLLAKRGEWREEDDWVSLAISFWSFLDERILRLDGEKKADELRTIQHSSSAPKFLSKTLKKYFRP